MNKKDIYRLLEDKMLKYQDFVGIPIQRNNEALLPIPIRSNLKVRQIDPQMFVHCGSQIFVRQTVLENLLKASALLQLQSPTLELEVVYGYRTLEIQTQLFEECKSKLETCTDKDKLLESVHKFIAIPEAAGHPTGGAVDVQLLKDGQTIDFGTKIWEFTEDSLVFSPFVTKEAWINRELLRRVMMAAGFAPFDGEWWHFSYGDKEWAKYYGKPFAFYEQLETSQINN